MEKQPIIKINPITFIAILIQIVFIVLLIVTLNGFIGTNREMPRVEVDGLTSEIEDLPEFGGEDIEHDIYLALRENISSETLRKNGIKIRNGSLINNYYESLGLYYVNFIIDIPDIEQSYQVIAKWTDDGYGGDPLYDDVSGVVTGVLCLDSDQLIYGEFDCKPWRDYVKHVIIDSLLDLGQDEIGNNIMLTSEYRDNMEDYKVKMEYFGCDTMCYCRVASGEEKKLAVEKFEGFIKGLGFKAEDVPIYFDNCEGDEVWIDEEGAFHLGARL